MPNLADQNTAFVPFVKWAVPPEYLTAWLNVASESIRQRHTNVINHLPAPVLAIIAVIMEARA